MMSKCKTDVCRLILRESFGEVAEKVAYLLLSKGACHLRQIASETTLHIDKVRKILLVLIQQNVVKFEKNKRGYTEYFVDIESLFWRQRIPRYIHCAKTLYGDAAELVVEDLVYHGQLMMSSVVNTVTDKLNEALEHAGHQKIGSRVVYDKFSLLAGTHFIQKCLNLMEASQDEEDLDERDLSHLFKVPPYNIKDGEKKRKRSTDESEPPAKKPKMSTDDETVSDDGVYWKINHRRFHQYFRDQLFIKAIHNTIDKRAADILQTMLRLTEVKSDDICFTTNPMSFTEIFQAIPRDLGITRNMCEQYLSLMTDDSSGVVSKVGESGGGMFVINIMKGLKTICKAHLESVVQERFGSKSLRIFRVLLLKQHLEQKQIEDLAMIPSKEAKELLYTMFAQNFVSVTEISKTPDHAPARTIFLFRVQLDQLARMLLENSYKALANAMRKRVAETKENRRLMEKQERVDAILASLEQSGADDAQKEEIQQTITPAERSQLQKVKHMINMLDQSELQLDETIFVLETFLYYNDQKLKFRS
ncbi:DNA-directed RNA polymerase III subunit RPC3-like [Ruditapes philippinarum]|uniref:DNA-directed RNA polymerase III subunit RPC3-like n=1 Tax=Ruditapes philippinarum TaxID=129788 RepID=UPI00295A99DE|nr:DNA-directed RNA polymerase III subunit RPC3-like [Ruditapes philippinarum]